MSMQVSNRLALFGVPDLNGVQGGSDSEDIGSLGPGNRGNVAFLFFQAEKLLDFSVLGVPEVDTLAQRDSQDVVVAPVEKVQVVVVDELRSVQDLFGVLRESSGRFLDLNTANSLVVNRSDLVRETGRHVGMLLVLVDFKVGSGEGFGLGGSLDETFSDKLGVAVVFEIVVLFLGCQ